MEVEFRAYDGSTAAINPRIERRGDQFIMKLNEQNTDYFLLFSSIPGEGIDLNDGDIQRALLEKKSLLPDMHNERINDKITASCIEWSDYRVNDYAIDVSSQIAEYTVVGCKEDQGRLIVFVPDESINCTACVSLTVSYRVSQMGGESGRGLFSKNVPNQMYYAVEFDNIPNYRNGGIAYSFERFPWEYPITSEMLAHGRFYIDAGCGIPKFTAKVSGLELRQA